MIKDDIKDVSIATVKGGVGLIPFVGPLFSELIGVYTNKKATKRFEQWAKLVEERLEKLDKKIDEDNEKFYSAMVKTTQIVAKTHQKEKLEYLANALINSADIDLDEDLNQIYLDLIERYTVSHILLLKFYLKNWRKSAVEQKQLVKTYFKNDGSFLCYQNQLFVDGLLGRSNDAKDGVVVMPFGIGFLNFISENDGANDEK